jgi:hypothetical protein
VFNPQAALGLPTVAFNLGWWLEVLLSNFLGPISAMSCLTSQDLHTMMCLHVAQKLTLTLNLEYSASPGLATSLLANSR